MNDRELLELAARAAGYFVQEYIEDGCWVYDPKDPVTYEGEHPIKLWNPLTSDADAFRLAVKLGLSVYVDTHPEGCHCTEVEEFITEHAHRIVYNHEGAPYAATRRAITQAAAEIGRGM